MSVEAQIAGLLRLAAEDLQGARLLAAAGNRNAAYLCEQSAEKVIRAVLTAEGTHAGIRHLLDEMVDKIPDANPLKPSLRAIQDLGAFATSFRYPTSAGRVPRSPDPAALQRSMDAVELALRAAVTAFDVELAHANKSAGRSAPAR